MICEKLKLINFGRHTLLEIDAECPVFGLLGPNGAGKSTVLDALEFAITGETRDPLPSYVHNLDGNARVEMTFRKNGKRGFIFRQFGSTAKRKLEWDGKEHTRAAEVDSTMATIFGADKRAIANAVFINQGYLEKILFPEKESERKDTFIRLVNMSFCSQRARILDGKIKKLEATIADLTPAILAMSVQRDTLANEVTLAQNALANLNDYTGELAFCDSFISSEEHLKRITASIGQVQNSLTLNETEVKQVLQILMMPSYERACENQVYLATALKTAETDLQTFTTIYSELAHYDRVNRDISNLNARILAAANRIRELNPRDLTDEQIRANLAEAEKQLHRHNYTDQANLSLSSWKDRLSALKYEFSAYGPPQETETQLAEMRLSYAKAKAAEEHFGAMLEVQSRLAKCMNERTSADEAQCPDCGLKLADPSQLSAERLMQAERIYTAMQTDNQNLMNRIVPLSADWERWHALENSYKAEIEAAEKQINNMRVDLQRYVPDVDRATAQLNYDENMARKQQLPQQRNELKNASAELCARMLEKAGYKLAAQHANNRAEFSVEKGQALRRDVETKRSNLETFEVSFAKLRDLTVKGDGYREQMDRLLADKTQVEKCLEAPMPSIVVQMVADKGPNLEAIRAELQSRQAARQLALGRLDQANQSYGRVNTEFQELKRRSEADVEKRRLIDDLRKLKLVLDDDGLPMAVVRYHFLHLATMTQECLNKLNSNFVIMIDPDQELGFKFVRLDDAEQFELPMNKLSGGQRVRLCLAFLMAVQRRLVKEVGLLVLDEPSIHIDTEGVESLADLLRDLQGQLKNTEIQVWVSDHHTLLENCFSKTLRLG